MPNKKAAKPPRHTDPAHHLYSSLREKIVEHVFIGEALRALWRLGVFDVEVLRGEFDAHGYDVVMGRGSVVRHIQLKTGVRDRPGDVSVSAVLANKPSGCVIWIHVRNDLKITRYWWFGSEPGVPLPPLGELQPKRIARTSDGSRPLRKKHRVVTASQFRAIDSLDAILQMLFGPLP